MPGTLGPDASIAPARLFRTLLDDGGNTNANLNYSAAPAVFGGTTPAPAIISRFELMMVFTGDTNFLDYGPVTGGLANGLRVQIVPAGADPVPLDFGQSIKNNFNLAEFLSGGALLQGTSDAPGRDTFVAAILEFRDIAADISIRPGDALQVLVNDDFTALTTQTFSISGYSIERY